MMRGQSERRSWTEGMGRRPCITEPKPAGTSVVVLSATLSAGPAVAVTRTPFSETSRGSSRTTSAGSTPPSIRPCGYQETVRKGATTTERAASAEMELSGSTTVRAKRAGPIAASGGTRKRTVAVRLLFASFTSRG